MIRFKHFIAEGENSLQISILKRANNDFSRSVKELEGFPNSSDMMKAVLSILDEYDVTVIADDNRKFAGRLIDSKGNQSFKIAPTSSINDREEFIPYPGVSLNISWTKSKDKYVLKDAEIS